MNFSAYITTDGCVFIFVVEVMPEPASLLALGTGVASLLALRRRKR